MAAPTVRSQRGARQSEPPAVHQPSLTQGPERELRLAGQPSSAEVGRRSATREGGPQVHGQRELRLASQRRLSAVAQSDSKISELMPLSPDAADGAWNLILAAASAADGGRRHGLPHLAAGRLALPVVR